MDGTLLAQSELIAEINATKSFWPQHFVEVFLPNNEDLPNERYVMREVRLSEFQKSGGVDFPGKVEEIDSDLRETTEGSGDTGVVCEVMKTTTLLVSEVAINGPVDPSEFVITFPAGTRFLDLDGETKIVDPDGTIENLSARFGEQSSGARQWMALGATTLLLAILVAVCSFRFLRARRSA